MPEGDTLHKIARRVGPPLHGKRVHRLFVSDLGVVQEAVEWTVKDVRALGKHLLVEFDVPWLLRTHLGMHGRVWRAGPERALPASPVFALTAAAGTPESEQTIVCTRAYRAELVRSGSLSVHGRLSRLGPDLLAEPLRLDDVLARAAMGSMSAREIAEVLLDQSVASGIGNVYKSEVLFLQRIHPQTPVGALNRAQLESVYAVAARLLRLNLSTRRRTTVPTRRRPMPNSPRLFVYGREGKPCLDCATHVERFYQGDMARPTYYCPTCQPPWTDERDSTKKEGSTA